MGTYYSLTCRAHKECINLGKIYGAIAGENKVKECSANNYATEYRIDWRTLFQSVYTSDLAVVQKFITEPYESEKDRPQDEKTGTVMGHHEDCDLTLVSDDGPEPWLNEDFTRREGWKRWTTGFSEKWSIEGDDDDGFDSSE
jgi:hypothetical protein